MRHEMSAFSDKCDNLVADQIRFDGRDSVSLNAFHSVESPEQVDELFMGAFAEIANVDSCDDDFLSTFGGDSFGLSDKFSDGTVPAPAAGERNRAIGAVIVTTVLYFQEMARAVIGRTRWGECPYIFDR